MKYVIVDNCLQGYSSSKYAGLHNLGPITSARIFEDLERANSIVDYLNSNHCETIYKVMTLKDALVADIKRRLEKGINSEVADCNKYYIPNQFIGIEEDIKMLEREGLL